MFNDNIKECKLLCFLPNSYIKYILHRKEKLRLQGSVIPLLPYPEDIQKCLLH